jgi:tetratricopeptide (TPR) repeat protein
MKESNKEKILKFEQNLVSLKPSEEKYYEILLKLSKFYRKSDSFNKAESLLERGKENAKKYKYNLYLADIYRSLSYIYLQKGNIDKAEKSIKRALVICKHKKGKYAEEIKANIYSLMGNINFADKKYAKALGNYKKALRKARKINFIEREITVKSDIANVYLVEKKLKKATDLLLSIKNDAMKYYKYSVPSLFLRLARIEYMQSNFSLAKKYSKKALISAKEQDLQSEIAQAIEGLGRIYLKEGDNKRAELELEKANKIFKELGLPKRKF